MANVKNDEWVCVGRRGIWTEYRPDRWARAYGRGVDFIDGTREQIEGWFGPLTPAPSDPQELASYSGIA